MTDTASTTSRTRTGPTWTRWLYRILAIVGIAVGIVVIIAVVYLLFAKSDCCSMMKADPPAAQSKDCCASMMKGMKMPMENRPSMSPMPNMPMPAPGR
ncbi:hypothetical protein [Mycobacterium intracellulare]|uniref:hypothetical protein n=1 Tax=Mycobacterium intracellulare TaxID=1767 RepID=UPI00138B140C|nr:hypothetical protein [Mycobacterium intracellulare]UGT95017.1 hypothetical protein LTQ55_14630 [Mycobacterium intracellulare]UGU09110.1 hypothetical protein LTQ56_11050 [Mycobacterium intracellulare subsp. intracellulare]UQC05805.1 hypothetical protein KN251_16540 [Mycobacterium intracellulare ATCC 13950]BCO58287.1 hypothetical protein MINTM005_35310 [Mycobacterium intracellulare]BCO68857.1 hypothetical protein MINTM007_34680 [Mycobacterium intracellulare]